MVRVYILFICLYICAYKICLWERERWTLFAKKTLFWGLSYFEWTHELQVTRSGPLGKPLRIICWRYISLWCPFSTKTAPIGPKSIGTSKLVSYFASASSWLVLCAYPLIVSFSNPVSSKQSNILHIVYGNITKSILYHYAKYELHKYHNMSVCLV